MQETQQKGFTLLEILLVIALIAILAGIVIVAINPAYQLANGRNTQRRSNVNTILNAVYQYEMDHAGSLPGTITTSNQVIGTNGLTGCDAPGSITCANPSGTPIVTAATCVDLTSALTPTYIVSIPYDPTTGSLAKTYYYITKDANNRVTVGSCSVENTGVTIAVTE